MPLHCRSCSSASCCTPSSCSCFRCHCALTSCTLGLPASSCISAAIRRAASSSRSACARRSSALMPSWERACTSSMLISLHAAPSPAAAARALAAAASTATSALPASPHVSWLSAVRTACMPGSSSNVPARSRTVSNCSFFWPYCTHHWQLGSRPSAHGGGRRGWLSGPGAGTGAGALTHSPKRLCMRACSSVSECSRRFLVELKVVRPAAAAACCGWGSCRPKSRSVGTYMSSGSSCPPFSTMSMSAVVWSHNAGQREPGGLHDTQKRWSRPAPTPRANAPPRPAPSPLTCRWSTSARPSCLA